jgi:SEC-C motif domain protein
MNCPCGTGKTYEACCKPVHGGGAAPTAEALMRARYSAYVKGEMGFLRDSLVASGRESFDEDASRQWSSKSSWKGLEILGSEEKGDEALVRFKARYELDGKAHEHHEVAQFKREHGRWFFVDGQAAKPAPITRAEPKVGRNDPCPCGSGKKAKKCCAAS